MIRRTWLHFAIVALAFSLAGCRTRPVEGDASVLREDDGRSGQYEAQRIVDLRAVRRFEDFRAESGFRDFDRTRGTATFRVLSDNPSNVVYLLGEFNNWQKSDQYRLQPVAGKPHLLECKVTGLRHGQQYRILLNDRQVIDPAAAFFSSPEDQYFNSVFWDFDRPEAYRLRRESVDLRTSAVLIGESEVWELARNWKHQRTAQVGPGDKRNTYRFIAESGIIDELKRAGYNAFEFVPFNMSMDGEMWKFRYQVFGLFAPNSRYGTPDDFARMVDAFNQAGIAVVMDAVIGHYPDRCETGAPCRVNIAEFGLHHWKKADGMQLYGQNRSPWGTYRYDYANPFVRRFLIDSLLHMMRRYGITGIRFDNYDGVRFESGGTAFLQQLAAEVREYRPEALLIAEMFFGESSVLHEVRCERGEGRLCRRDEFGNIVISTGSGSGINFRTHMEFFDFVKDDMTALTTDAVSMGKLVQALDKPWEWNEAARTTYVTNHDEAANGRGGATGKYVASLILGEESDGYRTNPVVGAEKWSYVQKKTKAYASLAMLSSGSYLDMPQLRLQQRGSFDSNPAVDWGQMGAAEEQGRVYQYFRDLSRFYTTTSAFSFLNAHSHIQNHYDDTNKIISLYRFDRAKDEDYYAVVNLSHLPINRQSYDVGVEKCGKYRLVLDADDRQYVGVSAGTPNTGSLGERLRSSDMTIDVSCDRAKGGAHGKPYKMSIPYIGEYSSVVFHRVH